MKKNLPSISAILYTSKSLRNGEHPIMLRISYNNQRKYKSLGYSCSIREWNDNKSEVRANHPNSIDINTIIRKEVKKANDIVLTLEKSGVEYSANSIVKALAKDKVSNITLFSLFDERITFFKEKAEQYNTATGYTTLKNIIKRYTEDEDVELFEINSQWIRDFEAHLRTKYKDTSIKKYFDCFKAIMNYAVEQKYIEKSPLDGYTHIKKLDIHTKKRALNLSELASLEEYYINTYGIWGDKKTNLEQTKKHYWNKKFKRRGTTKLTTIDAEQLSLILYFCSYYFQGLALVDLAKLKWKDLQKYQLVDTEKFNTDVAIHGLEYAQNNKEYKNLYKIEIARAKTNHSVRIVIEQDAIDMYLNPLIPNDVDEDDEEYGERYVFPIFADVDNTASKRFGRMTYATYLVNNNLKRVGDKLGIKGITFYSARHTYASVLYHNNVSTGLIAQNMGRNPADIETYLKDFEDESILKANELSYLSGQPSFISAKEKKQVNPEKIEFFKTKQDEKQKLLEKYGGTDGYNTMIQQKIDELEKELTEKFGDNTAAKMKYLMEKNSESN